jgi:hypothetical protein
MRLVASCSTRDEFVLLKRRYSAWSPVGMAAEWLNSEWVADGNI